MNKCQLLNLTIQRLCNNKQLLPTEYQQVKYLQSGGTQWIDTGIKAQSSTAISIDFAILQGFSFSTYSFVFGAMIDATMATSYSVAINGLSSLRMPNGTSFQTVNISSLSYNQPTNIYYRNNQQKINDIQVSTLTANANNTTNIALFWRNSDDRLSQTPTANLRIYSTRLYSDETLIRDFVPCYRKSDNVAGMYDLVTNTFYTNAGTGDFTVGHNA